MEQQKQIEAIFDGLDEQKNGFVSGAQMRGMFESFAAQTDSFDKTACKKKKIENTKCNH